jgi:hypothetical protein
MRTGGGECGALVVLLSYDDVRLRRKPSSAPCDNCGSLLDRFTQLAMNTKNGVHSNGCFSAGGDEAFEPAVRLAEPFELELALLELARLVRHRGLALHLHPLETPPRRCVRVPPPRPSGASPPVLMG